MLTLIAAMVLAPSDSCCASMKDVATSTAFQAAHLAPLALQWKPKYGKMGTFKVGYKDVAAFIVPPAKKSFSAVIMIHEWWGLNDYIKKEAERLHEVKGWGVVAIDLYGGKVADNPTDAGKYMQAVDDKMARETVKVASGQLKRGTLVGKRVKKVGTIGFCFGGGWSFQAALAGGKDVDACVMFYGMPETDPAKLAPLKAPVLGIFAKRDGWITPEVVSKFEDAMMQAKKSLTVRSYDADHAFANPSNPKYDKANADAAWGETLKFLTRYLRVS